MKKIAIIGAGQLGSRHLQGLAQCDFDLEIEVVEPFEGSREIAKQRYEEISKNNFVKKIYFYKTIDELSKKLDLVIVATSANIRFVVTKELLEKKNVTNLLLEKVLFQTIEEYAFMEKILKEKEVNCWVNHPRRMFPIYKRLKKLFKNSLQISYHFSGGNWGLGCNALHFIDHLSYLSNAKNLTISNEFLDKKIYLSPREDFSEFNGLLVGKLDNHTFSLQCNEKETPFVFIISSDEVIATIDENMGTIELSKKLNNWKKETLNEKIVYYQSELTQILASEILFDKRTTLPTYQEAMNLHLPFIDVLLNHMQNINNRTYTVCPIT